MAARIDSYVPHVVGGVKYTQGWGGVTGVVAYDSNYEEWAGKVRLDVNVSDAAVAVRHGRLRLGQATVDSAIALLQAWGGNWAVWGGATYKFNEKTSFNAPGFV